MSFGAPSTALVGASSTALVGASSTRLVGASSTGLVGASSTGLVGASSALKLKNSNSCKEINKDPNKVFLTDSEKKSILLGSMLKTVHIDKFHSMLSEQYEIPPMSVMKESIQFSKIDSLKFHDRNKPHLQLLHSCNDLCTNCTSPHWTCCYFDTKAIFIYDSKNEIVLHPSNISFLKKFFHPYFSELPIHFQPVQRQVNPNDSGLFAIAFATSIFFNKSPANISYYIGEMRPHLYNMFQNDELSLFGSERRKSNNLNPTQIFFETFPNKKIRSRKSIKINGDSETSNFPTIEINLWSLERDKILEGSWLTDISVIKFHNSLCKFSNFLPLDTLLVMNIFQNRTHKHRKSTRIEPMPRNQSHLQVIHTNNHSISIFFDKNQIFVYNSLHSKHKSNDYGQ